MSGEDWVKTIDGVAFDLRDLGGDIAFLLDETPERAPAFLEMLADLLHEKSETLREALAEAIKASQA